MWRAAPLLVVAALVVHGTSAYAAGTVQHLDPTFGVDGFLLDVPSVPVTIVRQPDGLFLLGGSDASLSADFSIIRIDDGGVADSTFGVGGTARVDVSGAGDGLGALAVQPDRKIVAAGTWHDGNEEGVALARLNPDGTLDGTFGSGGRVMLDVDVEGYDAKLQPDGALVVVGGAEVNGKEAFGVLRVDANGALDPSFGLGGVVVTQFFPGVNHYPWRAALQPDGKIVVVGVVGNLVVDQDYLIVRYEADGTVDDTFGNGGALRVSLSPYQDIAYDVAIQPDGKIVVVGGYYPTAAAIGFGLVRLLSDGSFDATFGENGIVRTELTLQKSSFASDIGDYPGGYARGISLLGDGRIVVAGGKAIARYLADGTLDATFGGGAISTLVPDGRGAYYFGVAALPDGTAIAVGSVDADDGQSGTTGLVAGYAPCTCPACERCDGTGGCIVAPQTGCYTATQTSLILKNDDHDAADALAWKWLLGEATTARSLGIPHGATDYALCVYDESGAVPTVALRASLPSGTACGGSRCWRMSSFHDAAKYKDKLHAAGPITTAAIKTGALYESRVKLKGKGATFAMPPLPLATPFRVQLQNETGRCWEAVYDASDIVKADAHTMKAAQ